MKILSLHCDYIKFKPVKKALKEPEKLSETEKKEKTIKEALVVFTAVEQGDDNLAEKLVESIEDIAKQVKAKNIVLYPYAHLSSDLASPEIAQCILQEAEKKLKNKFNVVRAPFGYYKQFELKCKGHPLAELSREIKTSKEKKEKITKPKLAKTVLDTRSLSENDHRVIGQKLDLFSFSEAAPGMVFWHPKGLIIYNELIKFWRQEHINAGYQEISTPQIMDKKLWLLSGHWEHYKDFMFLTEYENREFAVKPMNCPGAMLVYKSKPRSYKEFPLRFAELGIVHRKELSGVLSGLFRAIKFTQDDAHIFCTETQLEGEIENIIKLIEKFYKVFNFPYSVELSTRPKKFMGEIENWNKSEKSLEKVLRKNKIKFKVNKGEGAFYGPKIDFHIKDSLGRTWQLATIQLDFQMAEKFNLKYIAEDNKEHTPIMIHRVVYGALERFIAILLEHYKGNLPLWLSPIQARIISFTEKNVKAAEKIKKQFEQEGIRADVDIRNMTVNSKVREADLIQKIPYIIVMGDKEEKSKTLAVRPLGKQPKFGVKTDSFIKEVKEQIEKKK